MPSEEKRPPTGKRHYLAPETRAMWKQGTLLSATGLALALIPRAGRLRRFTAGCVGGAGVVILTFALLESAVDPMTVRRRVRPWRDLVSMFLR